MASQDGPFCIPEEEEGVQREESSHRDMVCKGNHEIIAVERALAAQGGLRGGRSLVLGVGQVVRAALCLARPLRRTRQDSCRAGLDQHLQQATANGQNVQNAHGVFAPRNPEPLSVPETHQGHV